MTLKKKSPVQLPSRAFTVALFELFRSLSQVSLPSLAAQLVLPPSQAEESTAPETVAWPLKSSTSAVGLHTVARSWVTAWPEVVTTPSQRPSSEPGSMKPPSQVPGPARSWLKP